MKKLTLALTIALTSFFGLSTLSFAGPSPANFAKWVATPGGEKIVAAAYNRDIGADTAFKAIFNKMCGVDLESPDAIWGICAWDQDQTCMLYGSTYLYQPNCE